MSEAPSGTANDRRWAVTREPWLSTSFLADAGRYPRLPQHIHRITLPVPTSPRRSRIGRPIRRDADRRGIAMLGRVGGTAQRSVAGRSIDPPLRPRLRARHRCQHVHLGAPAHGHGRRAAGGPSRHRWSSEPATTSSCDGLQSNARCRIPCGVTTFPWIADASGSGCSVSRPAAVVRSRGAPRARSGSPRAGALRIRAPSRDAVSRHRVPRAPSARLQVRRSPVGPVACPPRRSQVISRRSG